MNDFFLRVKKNISIENDPAFIRGDNAGDTFKSHAFTASRRAKKAKDFILSLKMYVQGKIPQFFLNIYKKRYYFSFLYKRLTARSTTAEIPRFTRTHLNARTSSLVLHS